MLQIFLSFAVNFAMRMLRLECTGENYNVTTGFPLTHGATGLLARPLLALLGGRGGPHRGFGTVPFRKNRAPPGWFFTS